MKAHLIIILIGLAWFGAYTYADAKGLSRVDACVFNTVNSIERLANMEGGDYVVPEADYALATKICKKQIELNDCVANTVHEIEKQRNLSEGDYIATSDDKDLALKVCELEIESKVKKK